MGVKGKRQGARLKGRTIRKRENQKGLYNKLVGIPRRSYRMKLDNRPDPFQKVAVFVPAEKTAVFSLLNHGGFRRGGSHLN